MDLVTILRLSRSRLVVRDLSWRGKALVVAWLLHRRLHGLLGSLGWYVYGRRDEHLSAWASGAARTLVGVVGWGLTWWRLHRLARVVHWRRLV